MDREPAAPECAAVKGTATAVKSTTAETTTVKSAAAESTAATAAKAAAVPSAAVTNLGRQAIACMFRHWSRTGARKRERFGALRRCGCECENRRSRNAQTADEAAPGIGYRHG
jgi:poly-gamma-glutamate capsule biosynthesis protein CapA/YwtB (metallophosphatase superfamily)